MRAAWTIAALISAFTIGIATLRPYLFDASPEWTTSVLSASILVFVLFPFFFSTGRGEPSRAIAVLALGGCIFAVYARALENGFFWDDFTFARTISFSEWLYTFYGSWNWTGIGNDYYRPLTVTLFQMDYLLYGFRPVGYHLTNILLHILNAYLVAHILSGWVRWRWAVAGSALFALHPMCATAMAWISQRTDSLSTAFYLLALIAVERYLERPSRRYSTIAGALYAAALASKEVAITFPIVALAFALARHRARQVSSLMIVLVGIGMLYTAGWITLFHNKLSGANVLTQIGTVDFIHYWHSLLRLLALIFVPVFYPSHDYRYLTEESLIYLYGGAAIFLALTLMIWKWGSGKEKGLLYLGTTWILVTVIPLYNLEHPDFIRLGYLPAVGVAMLSAALLSSLAKRPKGNWIAATLLLVGICRALPIDERIITYWGPHGDLAAVVNRNKLADEAWQDRLDPRALASFHEQIDRAVKEKRHVDRLLMKTR